MIMKSACPHCDSESIVFDAPEYEWFSDTECICTWDGHCDNGHDFIISEVLNVTSRLVAKDSDDLDRLVEEEKE